MIRTRQKTDYKAFPIVVSAAKSAFEEEELEEDRLLRDILEGKVSIEDRLEGMPKFTYDLHGIRNRSRYQGQTLEELREIWKEGKKEVEIEVTKSWVSRFLASIRGGLEGILLDQEREVIVSEEISLEKKREKALEELKYSREEEKKSMRELDRARGSLRGYVSGLDERHVQDEMTFPKLARFASKLEDEILSTRGLIERDGLSPSEKQAYRIQVERGQEYFASLVNQIGYLKKEMQLLGSARDRYSKVMVRMNTLVDRKESALRESLVKIKEAEMTKDLGIIVEAANYFMDLEDDMAEIEEITQEALEIVDASFDAVDREMQRIGGHEYPGETASAYRDDLFDRKSAELAQILG